MVRFFYSQSLFGYFLGTKSDKTPAQALILPKHIFSSKKSTMRFLKPKKCVPFQTFYQEKVQQRSMPGRPKKPDSLILKENYGHVEKIGSS